MKKFLLVIIALAMPSGPGWGQTQYEATPASTNAAMTRGETREVLSAMEAQAAEAEQAAASSAAPRPYLIQAARAYTEAARAARRLGQLQKAIAHASKGLAMAEKASQPGPQTGAIYQLLQAYRELGDYATERAWIDKGMEIVEQIPDESRRRFDRSSFLRESGTDLLRRGKIQEAIDSTAESLRLLEGYLADLKSRADVRAAIIEQAEDNLIYTFSRLGAAYKRAGKLEEGIKAYESGLAYIEQSGFKTYEEIHLLLGVGDIYFMKEDFPRARQNLQRALEAAERVRYASLVYSVSTQLGDLDLQAERPAEAISHYRRAIEIIESIRSLLESEQSRSIYVEDKRDSYGGIVVAHSRTNNFEQAFNYNERARSRAFLDMLGSKVRLARGGALLDHERALQARIGALRTTMAGQQLSGSEGLRPRQEIEAAEKAYADFLAEVQQQNKEQASLINVEPLTLKQLQDRLDPGVTLLEYFVVRDQVLLWIVEKDRVRFVNIPIARTDLIAKVTALREAVYQIGEKEKFGGVSRDLYRLLIEPALPHVRGKELLIVPNEALHYLPFQALLSRQGKYLIEDYPVYYLSSASLMQFTQEKRRPMGEKILAFGNPDLGDSKPDLEFAEREAKQIQAHYPKAAVFLKREATKERAKTLSPQSDIIHFASHTELSTEDPLSSAILLARGATEDGRLEVREIFGMDLKANLVVLSACETGLGKLSNGDELVGLTRAFIYAGAPSVVASLWKIDDGSTAELMGNFYRNLKTMTKAEALRQAQLTLIRGAARSDLLARRGVGGIGRLGNPTTTKPASIATSDPYFWAAFILVGDGK